MLRAMNAPTYMIESKSNCMVTVRETSTLVVTWSCTTMLSIIGVTLSCMNIGPVHGRGMWVHCNV